MIYYVDRIEGELAVLESREGERVTAPLSVLPADVREGSVLSFADGMYTYEPELTRARRRRLHVLQNRLKRKSKKKKADDSP